MAIGKGQVILVRYYRRTWTGLGMMYEFQSSFKVYLPHFLLLLAIKIRQVNLYKLSYRIVTDGLIFIAINLTVRYPYYI